MTSYPLKMTSYHSQILLIARFWVDLFEKTVVVEIQPTSCLLNFHTCTLLFDFKLEKPLQSKRKSINQTLFSTKSTTLNPMVKSDLATYRGVTMPNLFLQATIQISLENTKSHHFNGKSRQRFPILSVVAFNIRTTNFVVNSQIGLIFEVATVM